MGSFSLVLGSPDRQRPVEQVRGIGGEPGDPGVRSEPGLLPSGELAGQGSGFGDCLGLREISAQAGDGLGIADRGAGGAAVGQPLREQDRDLVEQPWANIAALRASMRASSIGRSRVSPIMVVGRTVLTLAGGSR
jgi:hypothetical protein